MNGRLAVVAIVALALAGCAEGRQRSVETRSLDSGVSQSTGGGESVLHNTPNVSISNGTADVTGVRSSPNSPCRTNPRAAGC